MLVQVCWGAKQPVPGTKVGSIFHVSTKKKGHHFRRCPIFHSKSSEEKNKIVTSADVLFSTQIRVKSKKRKVFRFRDGALSTQSASQLFYFQPAGKCCTLLRTGRPVRKFFEH